MTKPLPNDSGMVDELGRVLSGFTPRVLFAYLFGSGATAETAPLSDLDFAVYLDAAPGEIELTHKLSLYAKISRLAKRDDIDVVILNTCSNHMLVYDVLINGLLIYDAGSGTRAVVEQKMLHAAIDFKESRDRLFA
ncbi:MAG: nucleotidyltransferase domain-containing protein [Desulfobacterales bacterium]|nr:nucleotidyltransferase domain-containing protein [Desulfobacterales bacterium]